MTDPELGLSLVFNGCIYNYRELRAQLEVAGYKFFSHSDTEVILKAYHRWGRDSVEHFHGMFAFAIAEHETGRVVLARDRLGIKPLYVSRTPARLRFASTLPAVVAGGGVDTTIDRVALHHYMTFHSVVPAPWTILQGVRKLPPATVRTVERDGTETDHDVLGAARSRAARAPSMSAGDWQEALLAALRVAVKRRMVADVPIGDAPVGRLRFEPPHRGASRRVGRARGGGLKTFSIGFEAAGGERGDEFEYSDLVAREFGTEHRRIAIDDAHLVPAAQHAIPMMSEPMISHDCVAFFLLSEEVSKAVKVVQSGQGADEILPATVIGLPRRWPRFRGRVPSTRTRACSSIDRTGRCARCSPPSTSNPGTRAAPSWPSTLAEPAPRRRWTPRCASTRRSCSSTIRSSGSTT